MHLFPYALCYVYIIPNLFVQVSLFLFWTVEFRMDPVARSDRPSYVWRANEDNNYYGHNHYDLF